MNFKAVGCFGQQQQQQQSQQTEQIYVLTVDSRNKSSITKDPNCYKEATYDVNMFNVHIHDDPQNICVRSPVAELCGLDLKIYFHEPRHHHHHHHHVHSHGVTSSSPATAAAAAAAAAEVAVGVGPQTNGIATLLTFNPETGKCHHLVCSKAYVLLNDGRSPLSRHRLASIVQLIRQAGKELYRRRRLDLGDERHHQHHHHNETSSLCKQDLQDAYDELLQRCSQYRQGDEFGTTTTCSHRDDGGCVAASPGNNSSQNYYGKRESGVSDAATCNHSIATSS
jgi:hypothetical protein